MKYKNKFVKLVNRIRTENIWIRNDYEKEKDDPGRKLFNVGAMFAYDSILKYIEELEKEGK